MTSIDRGGNHHIGVCAGYKTLPLEQAQRRVDARPVASNATAGSAVKLYVVYGIANVDHVFPPSSLTIARDRADSYRLPPQKIN